MDAVIDSYKPPVRGAPTANQVHRRGHTTGAKTPQALVATGSRIVIVAPHPDDEVLALGATLASLCRSGHDVLLIAVTDGEGSHPASRDWTPGALRETRPRETALALDRLGIRAEVLRLGFPDGGVTQHEKRLAELLPLGSGDTVFVTWRHDGHADHEACARATLASCRTVGARCIEFPVWALVPSHAAHARLRQRKLQRVTVPPAMSHAKQHAIAAFSSQLQADGATPAVLPHDALQVWQQGSEWVMA